MAYQEPIHSGAALSLLPLNEQIRLLAERHPSMPALLSRGRRPLTYGALWPLIVQVAGFLNELGIGRRERVALVLPNGAEMLVAFLGISAAAACAPLNPDYREQEFEFYFTDLRPKALIVQSEWGVEARRVARALGISIIDLTPLSNCEAGTFTLLNTERPLASEIAPPDLDDVALVLHTSGTTSRPKMVPLSHENLCVSASNIATALGLQGRDRCLDPMPLFHVHGLIGGALSSLVSGGSVIVMPQFRVEDFFHAIRYEGPTWYTAVPTMHQAILSHTAEHHFDLSGLSLRFIRSCSAALPPRVMDDLEKLFQVPVIEAYGMTEAAHQIAINPLPPKTRKPGSVGIASGTEIAVMGEDGRLLRCDQPGEILVRGKSVTHGYESNPHANKESFVEGWFQTGDQGYLDPEGYLFLTGRIKELINRGGEKISPREVDEALLQHPAVTQAATFAVPHQTLGEDVAAAIVLRWGQSATKEEIRRFVASRVASFKVPREIVIVDAIPKGPTGKLRRLELATLLGTQLKTEFVEPKNKTEKQLAALWSEILGGQRIGARDDFFSLGGDSLVAARLFARIKKVFGKDLPLLTLLESPTVEKLAEVLQGSRKNGSSSCLVPIQLHGRKPPFFCIHGPGGQIINYVALAANWDRDQPFFGVQARALVSTEQPPHRTVEQMAAYYIDEIRTVQPQGPYFLGGFCLGGQIAFEMARQLQRQGENVALVALMESYVRRSPKSMARHSFLRNVRRVGHKVVLHLAKMRASSPGDALTYLGKRFTNASILARLSLLRCLERTSQIFGARLPKSLELRDLTLIHYQAGRSYVTQPYTGRVVLLTAKETVETSASTPLESWAKLAPNIEAYEMECSHDNMLAEPHVRKASAIIRKCIERGRATRLAEETKAVHS